MQVSRSVTSIALLATVTALNGWAAVAADAPAKVRTGPAAPAPITADWSGFYFGGHAGWGSALSRGTYDDSTETGPIDFAATGFLYGAQAGYNWQVGRLVYGVEVDGTWSSRDASRVDLDGDRQRMETDLLASARFRSGAVIDNVFLFGSIGLGYAQSKFTVTGGDVPSPAARDIDGFGIASGFGAEITLAPNWSLRGEYLYYAIHSREELSGLTNDADGRDFAKIDGIHVARVAANYRFNGSQARGTASSAMDWSGFYAGGHGGYGRSRIVGAYDAIAVLDNDAFDIDPTGGAGGVQLGYNMQRGAWVYGVEADYSWAGMSDERIDPEGDTQTLKTTEMGSVRGRIGVAADNRLYYLTAGWGRVNSRLNVIEAGASAGTSFSSSGPVIGSGLDWALTPNWSVRLEGLTYLTDNKRSITTLTVDSDVQDFVRQDLVTVIRAGVNYRFGGPN